MRKPWRLAALALLMGLMLLTAACGNQDGPLSKKQLAKATAALADYFDDGDGERFNNGINAYHVGIPDYDRPQEIPLGWFLTYFRAEESLTNDDAEEFYALTALPEWVGSAWNEEQNRPLLPTDLPVPTWRIPEAEVNAVLNQWLGIDWREIENLEGVLYLEEYHAFYTDTSDALGSNFQCVRGRREGDTLWLWSQASTRYLPEGSVEQCRRLTLKLEEDRWHIEALHWVDPVE